MERPTIDVADFSVKALPEIEKLARHFNVDESRAVEAYGYIIKLLNTTEVIPLERCLNYLRVMTAKSVDKLSQDEGRLGLALGLLRIKQKPFLSDPKLKTGRNEPCPCGSGAKFKNCCLNAAKKFDFERYNDGLTIK